MDRRLYYCINPVCGSADGKGWPLGRGISISEVYATIQEVAGVDYIEEVTLSPVKEGERGEATTRISISPDGLICSHQHEIAVE